MPFPVMGPEYLTTASEVATMDFVRTELGLPAPEVLAWSSDKTKTDVNAEFIMYEKVGGRPLQSVWSETSFTTDKYANTFFAATFSHQHYALCSRFFSQIGSLYYKEDVSEELRQRPLYDSTRTPETPNSSRFRIGPTIERDFYRGGRASLQIDRGPCKFSVNQLHPCSISNGYPGTSAHEYFRAHSSCERACILSQPKSFPSSQRRELLDLLNKFDEVVPALVPDDSSATVILAHPDLHADNLLVSDPTDTSKESIDVDITAWLDWQGATIRPYYLQMPEEPPLFRYSSNPYVNYPSESGGPEYTKGFSNPDLDPVEKKLARKAFQQAERHRSFCSTLKDMNPILNNILAKAPVWKHTHTLARDIMAITTGDAAIPKLSLIRAVEDWNALPNVEVDEETGEAIEKCPVQFSAEEREACFDEMDMLLKAGLLQVAVSRALGISENSDGFVKGSEAQLLEVRKKGEDLLRSYLDGSESDEEREWYEKTWPYQDGLLSMNAESCY